jgi:hypothetical protein
MFNTILQYLIDVTVSLKEETYQHYHRHLAKPSQRHGHPRQLQSSSSCNALAGSFPSSSPCSLYNLEEQAGLLEEVVPE